VTRGGLGEKGGGVEHGALWGSFGGGGERQGCAGRQAGMWMDGLVGSVCTQRRAQSLVRCVMVCAAVTKSFNWRGLGYSPMHV